jgi:ornithine cyclodeaminase/alanine dehydrogenase-like protein (mu-crystallin family)
MPAFVRPLNSTGIKWAAVYDNQKPGFPTIGATVILNDVETGSPIAFMDGISITNMRTAGHSAVAAKYLAKKDSSTVALIGCGAEARTHLPALNELFPLKTVKICDIKPEAMVAFKQEMSESFSLDILPTKSVQEAVEGTDIICMLTTSLKPVLFEPWIPAGCFVSGVMGFYDLDAMITKKADKWVLGCRQSDQHLFVEDGLNVGEGIEMKPSMEDVYGDMGEIVTGVKPGRQNKQERIVYVHAGAGTHDVALAKIAYTRAKEQGIGTTVSLI